MSRYQRSMRDALQSVADGQMEFDEAVKWEVKITGLPTFYADGKSKGDVRRTLRKLLKRPDEIVSIERTTPAELKKIRRGQIQGDEPGDEGEEVKEELLLEDNRAAKVQNKELSIDDIVNMIQFGKPFDVVDEDIPATLPPGDPNFPRYKDIPNSVVDKEDKKANKVKAKAEKDTLVPTETQEGVVSDVRLSRDVKVKKENYERWFEASEWAKAQEKDKKNQNKDPVGKQHEETHKSDEKWRENFKKQSNKRRGETRRRHQAQAHSPGQRVLPRQVEVAPPGWGHTVAKKEKSKPNKPKSKIGGSAHEFQKDLDSGKFKGLPGDKTYKDKKASMFKLMWSMKNKGDKPHYKPGVKDKLKAKYKKDESVLDSAKRYLVR